MLKIRLIFKPNRHNEAWLSLEHEFKDRIFNAVDPLGLGAHVPSEVLRIYKARTDYRGVGWNMLEGLDYEVLEPIDIIKHRLRENTLKIFE